MPNPFDVGSAKYLASLGFPALASTSAGYAVANLSPAKAARQRGWSGDWAARRATEPTTLVNP